MMYWPITAPGGVKSDHESEPGLNNINLGLDDTTDSAGKVDQEEDISHSYHNNSEESDISENNNTYGSKNTSSNEDNNININLSMDKKPVARKKIPSKKTPLKKETMRKWCTILLLGNWLTQRQF